MLETTIVRRVFCISLLLFSGAAWSNQVKEMSLENKAKSSDLVVVGNVQFTSTTNCKGSSSCAGIKISYSLKGKAPENMLVLFDGPIAEMNPNCCEVGATYLFFLERLDGKFFRSANGPFGIYRMDESNRPKNSHHCVKAQHGRIKAVSDQRGRR